VLRGFAKRGTGGETPPEPAGEDAYATLDAGDSTLYAPVMPGSSQPNHLVAGLHSRGGLPHLKREGGAYFVTFRQAGTLPRDLLLRFKQEREAIVRQAEAAKRPLTWPEQEELFRWYASRVDKYLDAGHATCHLNNPEYADLVAGALGFFNGPRYELRAWVVMPNHAHVVVWPKSGHTLSDILHSWKSFTSHEINQRLRKKLFLFGRANPTTI
jgi:hypothetical protein